MREFDRGYSEVTFSKIAVEVKADEAVIHKEYHLSSADPNIVGVEKSIPVGFTNFNSKFKSYTILIASFIFIL